MRTFKLLAISAILASVIYSCSNKNKAVNEYCNCISTSLTDKMITVDPIVGIQKKCYDSIIVKKYELIKDIKFIAEFDSIQNIKNIKKTINTKILKNISDILVKFSWEYYSPSEEKRIYSFDGKMVTQDATFYTMQIVPFVQINTTGNERFTGTYKVEVEDNGSAYVSIIWTGDKNDIYKLMKTTENSYYLEGKRTLSQKDK